MNIKNILLLSFFLFILPSLIVFSVETVFYTDVDAQNSNFAQEPQEGVKTSPVNLVDSPSHNDNLKAVELNKVDEPHPLKYSYAVSSQNNIEQLNKKEEVKKEEPSKKNKPLAHPQVEENTSPDSKKKKELNTPAISKNNEKPEEVKIKQSKNAISYSNVELDMLAKIIHAEAGSDTYEGKLAIGAVVLNRLQSNSFPNSIEGVIFSKNQFAAVIHGTFSKANPASEDYEAAIDAFNGFDPTGGALYYYSPSKTTSKWHETLNYLATVGNNRFFTNEKVEHNHSAVKVESVEEKTSKTTEEVVEKSKSNEKTVSEPTVKNEVKRELNTYTEQELDMLAKIIHAEAGAESYEGKVAVGAVILNRVQSNSFENTLKGVIYAPKQFEPVATGSFDKAKPTTEDYEAAIESFNGVDPTGGATFFYAPKLTRSDYHESMHYLTTIGNHRFFTNEKAS